MSIEQNLEKIAATNEQMVALLTALVAGLSVETVGQVETPVVAAAAPVAAAPVLTSVPAPAVAAAAPVAAAAVAPTPPAATTITAETLNAAAIAAATRLGDSGAAVRNLLTEFGVNGFAALPQAQFATFNERMAAL